MSEENTQPQGSGQRQVRIADLSDIEIKAILYDETIRMNNSKGVIETLQRELELRAQRLAAEQTKAMLDEQNKVEEGENKTNNQVGKNEPGDAK